MGDFSSTPREILEMIFERLCKNPIDSLSFARVSKEWRSIAVDKRRHILSCPLIFPLQDGKDDQNTHDLFTLSSSACNWEISLPEIRKKYCLASNKGWLLVADASLDEIFLLNPLTKDRIPLPSLPSGFEKETLKTENLYDLQYTNMAVFTLNFRSTSDYQVAVAVYKCLFLCGTRVDMWTVRNLSLSSVEDIMYYKGRIYVIYNLDYLEVFILNESEVTGVLDGVSEKIDEDIGMDMVTRKKYLIETPQKELLEVSRYEKLNGLKYTTSNFEVFKFNDRNKNWIRVEDLGDQVVFLGVNSLCLSSRDVPGCSANSIYFLDYMENNEWHDMGVFNMKDRCIKPLLHDGHPFVPTPALWFTPNLGDEKEKVSVSKKRKRVSA